MSLNFNSIITEVTKVQEEASKILLSPEEHGLSREIILKEQGKDYTQEIDRHIEGMIKERFSLLFPEIGFMGEETDSRGEDKRFSWLVSFRRHLSIQHWRSLLLNRHGAIRQRTRQSAIQFSLSSFNTKAIFKIAQ